MKQIINRRVLECVKYHKELLQHHSHFKNDFDYRMKNIIELRKEFSDVIPVNELERQMCVNYLNNIENENYEDCDNFIIQD